MIKIKNKFSNRKASISIIYALCSLLCFAPLAARCDDAIAADDRPVFQQIADLEQARVLLQLEKEKAQLMLDLDRMAAEQSKLRGGDNAGGPDQSAKADAIAQLQKDNAKLQDKLTVLQAQMDKLKTAPAPTPAAGSAAASAADTETAADGVSAQFRLIQIIGVGRELQATIEDLKSGQRRKISVGGQVAGYNIRSISLDEGVVFEKDGTTDTLGVGSSPSSDKSNS
ncbi:MAG: hypothetical protein FWC51_02310 [Proteobacteria bacterium]|nr:hypothetical protein [Pseudomonadota bacterium]